MKIVVIGGTGRIGAMLVARLARLGHEAVAAAPSTGVNTLTGEGVDEALSGAQVVVDVANSPSFDDAAALAFFETAGRFLLAAEDRAGVAHHVALSVVGADRLPDSGYLRAKIAQERLIRAGQTPYTIVRSTQFFPFIEGIIAAADRGGRIPLSPALIQPIDPEDVAAALVEVVLGAPANGVIEVSGPEPIGMNRFAEAYLSAHGDPRVVIADPTARYFGAVLEERSLLPGDGARRGATTLQTWLRDGIPAD